MKTRERAIMDYTRRMGELGAEHTEALTAATLSYLEYLQAGSYRSESERIEAELRWRRAIEHAHRKWKRGRAKAQDEYNHALLPDPALSS